MIQYVEAPAHGYQPGVCNIGPAEIARRRRVGYLGLAGAVGLAALLLALDAPAIARLLIAVPVAGSLSGFIQARLRFCAGFGMAGLQNLGELGDQVSVEDAEARQADRAKALRIHAASMAGGLAAGVAFALLPL
jgi:hypothetical protein